MERMVIGGLPSLEEAQEMWRTEKQVGNVLREKHLRRLHLK